MESFTLKEAALAVGGKVLPKFENIVVESVSTDSREIKGGALFIPIKGENFDGHDFIADCIKKGAAGCFSQIPQKDDIPCVLVEDTKKALRDLAEFYIGQFNIPKCAVTGSVGKTTTKDMIASVFSQHFKTLKTQGNFNNDIGLPRTVFGIDRTTEAAVLEMGMNHFGEIHNLSKIVHPSIGVVTNIGVSHIENLGSREGILKAKMEILDFMQDDGVLILNGDDSYLRIVRTDKRKIYCGIDNPCDVYADNIVNDGLESTLADIHKGDVCFRVKIPVPGRHMVMNALVAAAAGFELGLAPEEIKAGIENFEPTKMRMDIISGNGIKIINDVYNANPVSVKAAIDVLAGADGRKVAVLGDMFELGEFSSLMHKDVGNYAGQSGIDVLIAIGKDSKYIYDGAKEKGMEECFYYETQDEFLEKGISEISKGDTVLVKASRGMKLEKTVDRLQEVI